ncbi:hypothetical protein B0O41_3951 [Propionibacteriaceae bacterium ES.041]|nr:hypothetical protein B0O41_3951 [Propionibacteriaceae bacterium ES.041]
MSQQQLSAKQYAPLAEDEQRGFRAEAQKRGIGSGLLARALLLDGLDRLGDPALERRIDDEKTATKHRISDGARAAAQQRWANDEGAK